MRYIQFFDKIRLSDITQFGGKNASLGEMIFGLSQKGIRVPMGFATTADSYRHHLATNNLLPQFQDILAGVSNYQDIAALERVSSRLRELIIQAPLPLDLVEEVSAAYRQLSQKYHAEHCDVAVRSSATAEDLPHASFAGQQESYLHIQGEKLLLQACKQCMASLFTARAMVYRYELNIDHLSVAISVGVQKMVQSENACSGVLFTLDTESGFKDAVTITSSYGLGEMIVQGRVNPDEFCVQKTLLKKGFLPIIKKKLGSKEKKLIYTVPMKRDSVRSVLLDAPYHHGDFSALSAIIHPPLNLEVQEVPQEERNQFSLSDTEVLELARFGCIIEDYYSQLNNRWMPMDIEWAKDSVDGLLYIVQARPETVASQKKSSDEVITYSFKQQPEKKDIILTGQSVGNSIASGVVHIIQDISAAEHFKQGDILVTSMTDPDWVPLMKKAAAIITDQGGRTCHAAIVSRELSIPSVIGTENATKVLQDGQKVTIDCSRGLQAYVYNGVLDFTKRVTSLTHLPPAPVDLMINIGDPGAAFQFSFLPVQGVGLARLEFIISNIIKVHPMAIVYPEKVTDVSVKQKINDLAVGYTNAHDYYVEVLSQSIGMIAGAFYPRPVIVRLTDFKSNEYRGLIGGNYFEADEENPMLGFRGAVRYRNAEYQKAFSLECEALKKAREVMGFDNIEVMVPFVRTVKEAEEVLALLSQLGLSRGVNNLKLLMMVEIPSNVLLLDQFGKYFDGFSIGSNDLTQLLLGVDRDSGLLARLFDEQDEAVVQMIHLAISKARSLKKSIGICGQAPSDFPALADLFVSYGINYLSLLPDSVLPFMKRG